MALPIYKLERQDLNDIAHKTRLMLEQLRQISGILQPAEQRIEAICVEIEVAATITRRPIVITED